MSKIVNAAREAARICRGGKSVTLPIWDKVRLSGAPHCGNFVQPGGLTLVPSDVASESSDDGVASALQT